MAEAGVLTQNDRVELLEGWITPKMTHNPPHDGTLCMVEESLRARLMKGWSIRIQSAMTTADSEPEPDIAVVRGTGRDYMRRHPNAADVSLVVEIADSSLPRDREKIRIYARAGVPVYWIVNLIDERVEVYGSPSGPCDQPSYGQSAVYNRGERLAVNCDGLTSAELQVSDLLP
jgi:Uma2 family endonuclease